MIQSIKKKIHKCLFTLSLLFVFVCSHLSPISCHHALKPPEKVFHPPALPGVPVVQFHVWQDYFLSSLTFKRVTRGSTNHMSSFTQLCLWIFQQILKIAQKGFILLSRFLAKKQIGEKQGDKKWGWLRWPNQDDRKRWPNREDCKR